MNRLVWRTALGVLRANGRLVYRLSFGTFLTAESCGLIFGRRPNIPYGLLAIQIAFLWTLLSGVAPTHRDLLRLPLSTRAVGAVQFLLRVLLPCIFMMFLIPLIAPIFARTSLPWREWLALAGGLCAAFPLMMFAPLLPWPSGWRQTPGDLTEYCDDPRLRSTAVAALWLLAPALALLPFISVRQGFAGWPWISLAVGVTLATVVWMQRARFVRAVSRSAPAASAASSTGTDQQWRGWQGLMPPLVPLIGSSCALGIMATLFAGENLMHVAVITMFLILVTLSASLSANWLMRCIRVLRQLPIAPKRLAGILFAVLLLPTLFGSLIGSLVANRFHPDRISVGHLQLLCLLSLSCSALLFIPILKKGRTQAQRVTFVFALLLQLALALFVDREGIALPSDAWLLGGCLIALCVGLVWLTATLKSSAPSLVARE